MLRKRITVNRSIKLKRLTVQHVDYMKTQKFLQKGTVHRKGIIVNSQFLVYSFHFDLSFKTKPHLQSQKKKKRVKKKVRSAFENCWYCFLTTQSS